MRYDPTDDTNGAKRHQDLRLNCLGLAAQLVKPTSQLGVSYPLDQTEVVDAANDYFDFVMAGHPKDRPPDPLPDGDAAEPTDPVD